ncbi:LADA_0H07844g1_1 [Lachancea dasiensis]|uniref:Regulator of rDNA transcription protein 5 n=1 Tax=Lachancea dasiensis TaxID=1072105 RepID=A0A1G4K2A8_9SACH|nr:LADA_0H07844g1_1 [Lachancea dasiensis]
MATQVIARRVPTDATIPTNCTGSGEVKRIYVSNLDFSTTEEELKEFLSDYNVLTVLIPSQTIRGFRNSSVKPLGIGYADFPTVADAQNAVKDLNGKMLHGRSLKIKIYVPFTAAAREDRKASKHLFKSQARPVAAQAGSVHDAAEQAAGNRESTMVEQSAPVPSKPTRSGPEPVSEDTVYCAYLPSSTTDVELREFFAAYDPQDIFVYRSNVSRHRVHLYRRFTAALVTLGAPSYLENALSQLSSQKFMGKKITLRPARLNKIQEVKQAAVKKLELEQAQTRKKSIVEANEPISEDRELEGREGA